MAEHRFPVVDKEEVAEETLALWFDIAGTGFTYEEGQHANFELLDAPEAGDEGADRTFSFASAADDRDRFMIATRVRDTAFKQRLEELPLGKEVRVQGPGGRLTLHEDGSRPAIFLAGGIGVTPVRAIVEKATRQGLPHPIRLFYSNRTPAATAFLDELATWERDNPRFRMVATVTREHDDPWPHETGRIDEEMLRAHLDEQELEGAAFYVTGPPGFLEGMQSLLDDTGVEAERVHTEQFYGY